MARRRKKRTSSAKRTSSTRKTRTKRRGRRRKKSMLSEIVSPEGFKRTGKSYLGGLVGGVGAAGIDALLPANSSVMWRVAANGGVALVAGAMGWDSVAAGMGGATGYQLGQKLTQKLLSEMEEEEMADDDVLSDYPDALDEAGNPMFLAEDEYVERGLAAAGEFYYLEELEEMEEAYLADSYYLSESFQANDMYPAYINSAMF